ncbi:uncharacterized protein LOC121373221 isoform X2 [Gigantopelta aegis]|uniref:uncharacterized protein LOC121373221 isoform X2 n=1 Tax=Gigantopelta aegis TaxID=1735272 RepID=UPI001B8874B8|nr:uncharacterized protein LOC121373221 isoform X2 [Gigantopelta aegis]XP_041355645.1 uncharacterized protein LOC121373221 isoform X2 [Gigantopelta aegis]
MAWNYYIGVFVLVILTSSVCQGRSLWEEIQKETSVRWVAKFIDRKGLSALFKMPNVTVFLPSSEAYFAYNPSQHSYDKTNNSLWRSIFLYSSVDGIIYLSKLKDQKRIYSRLTNKKLYFNIFSQGDKKIITINGARIIKGDITADNGVLHIIDRFISPIESNATLAEYLEKPLINHFKFTSIVKAKIVVPKLGAETRNRSLFFTSFTPSDNFLLPMPEYGKDLLFSDWDQLIKVYKAHLIPYQVTFLPSVGDVPDVESLHGTLKFSRFNGEMYISNNQVKAKVIQANIPVANGVLHVIDNLLYFKYQNIIQKVQTTQGASKMSELLSRLPNDVLERLSTLNNNYTLFVPTDWAFGKIPISRQRQMEGSDSASQHFLQNLLYGHIVPGHILNSEDLSHNQKLTTFDNRTIRVVNINGETFLETSLMRAQLEVSNIGCTNGIIHLVSNVLFYHNFSLWEAIGNIPLVSIMHSFALRYPDVETALTSSSSGPMTVFIASNAVLQSAGKIALETLKSYPHIVQQALRGQIAQGLFSSSSIERDVEVETMAGRNLSIFKEQVTYKPTIGVVGSHVKAHVMVQDIWCSNGILHIVDDILHVPIRSIMEELERRPSLSVTQAMFKTRKNISRELSDMTHRFTVFIPHNDAYAKLPWNTVDGLLGEPLWLEKLMNAHIVKGEAKYIEDLADRQMLIAKENTIHIVKKNGQVYVINNNIWARVVTPNIPTANGNIHVIDRLLYVPQETIEEALENMEELSIFMDLMSQVPDFLTTIHMTGRNLTIFAPSSEYFKSVPKDRLTKMMKKQHVLQKLYAGHVLPSVRLDDVFFRTYEDEDYVSLSQMNTTFTLKREHNGAFIDVGFESQEVDLIGRGYGCTNGIIYIIDGLLNYSPYTIKERLQSYPNVQKSFGQLEEIGGQLATDVLSYDDMTFTFFVPTDTALHELTFPDFASLRNFPLYEGLKVFWRHAVNGSVIPFRELRHGQFRPSILPPEVTLETSIEGVFLRWKHLKSRVIHWNVCASNGIIHVIDKFLFTTSDPTSPVPRSTQSPRTIPLSDDIIRGISKGRCHSSEQYLMWFSVLILFLWLGV